MKSYLLAMICVALITNQVVKSTAAAIACIQDVKLCGNGAVVSRDPNNNCEFDPCPSSDDDVVTDSPSPVVLPPAVVPVGCTEDAFQCDDGTVLVRDPNNNCEFPSCPVVVVLPCNRDLHVCPDGSTVARDGLNECEFYPCPTTPPPAACGRPVTITN